MKKYLEEAVERKWSKEELPAWPAEHTYDKWDASTSTQSSSKGALSMD